MKIISRREAFEAGLKRYFDGKKCPSGHLSEKLVVNYTCIECLHQKYFAKRRVKRKAEQAVRQAEKALLPKREGLPSEKQKAKAAGLRKYFTGIPCHKGHIDERWTASGVCVSCAKEKGPKPRTPEQRKKSTENANRRYQENPEKYRKQDRDRRANDIQHHLRCAIRNRIKHAIRGHVKNSSALIYLGCSVAEAKAHLEKQFRPGMTWDNHTHKGWHIDHIIPICNFDMTDEEQRKKAFHFTNLQPLWATENLTKQRYPQKR